MTYVKYKNNLDMWMHAMRDFKVSWIALLPALLNEDNRGGIGGGWTNVW